MIGEYDKSVLLTYAGASASLCGMALTINQELAFAMMAFVVAGICDLFDGRFARRFPRTLEQEQFGIEIDSLCDTINFAAFPAVILITQIRLHGLGLVLAIIYVLGAVSRLAYFNRNAKHSEQRWDYFIGLPVTYSALVFPVTYVAVQWLNPQMLPVAWGLLGIIMPTLFVWKHRIPKPNKMGYIIFVSLAIATLISLGCMAYG